LNKRSLPSFDNSTPTIDDCLVDRDELIQAVTNLMRNSLQSTGRGAEPPTTLPSAFASAPAMKPNAFLIDIEGQWASVYRLRIKPNSSQGSFHHQGHVTKETGLGLGISRRFVRAFWR